MAHRIEKLGVLGIRARPTAFDVMYAELIEPPGDTHLVIEGKGYLADREGSLVSLTPWGHEVISPTWTLSPDASVDEPVWIANRELVPEKGDRVRVRISDGLDDSENGSEMEAVEDAKELDD